MSERPTGDLLGASVAELAQRVSALERAGALDVENHDGMEQIRGEMEQIVGHPGGAAALVARYGGDSRAALARPLAFLLAVEVNQRERARELATTVLDMIEQLRAADSWTRLNLCTAVQRLLIFGALKPHGDAVDGSSDGGSRSASLTRLLHEALAGPSELRATAAAVVADLFYRGYLGKLPSGELEALGDKVLALEQDEDDLTRGEAQGLREFLARSPFIARV